MESFFLSETSKYLFLLFDDDNILHTTLKDHVFTTEGHVFPINSALRFSPSSRELLRDGNLADRKATERPGHRVCPRPKWSLKMTAPLSPEMQQLVAHAVGLS